MAKKKSIQSDGEIIDYSSQLMAEIAADFGEGILSGANSILERPQKTISVSPSVDYMLGGGIPTGSWFVLTGKPKLGKSSTALHFMGNCQKEGMSAYILNCEGRLKPRDLQGIQTLNLESLKIIQSTDDKILSCEDFLSIADKILRTEKNVVMLIDSFSVLTEEARMMEFGKQTRGGQAKIISDFCSRLATVIPIKNSIVIGITHIIANTGGMGMAQTIEKTANSLAYQCDSKLKCTYAEPWTLGGENDDQIGQKIHWQCLCSGLRGPGRKGVSYLRYGHGLDEYTEYIQFGIDYGIVSKKASWLSLELPDFDPIKVQGTEKLRDELINNLNLYEKFKSEVVGLIP